MPFLDWVNKAQAQRTTADVPYHLLQLAMFGFSVDRLHSKV
jgi:hypothetical protein